MLEKRTIQQKLDQFRQNPKQFIQQLPVKFDSSGEQIEESIYFTQEEIANRDYVDKKDQMRAQLMAPAAPSADEDARLFFPILPGDRPEHLVDNPTTMVRKLADMEPYMSDTLSQKPWSDDYWPLYRGVLGARYGDENFPPARVGGAIDPKWNDYHSNVTTGGNELATIVSGGDSSRINKLSPSEKYDLLVGIDGATLTEKMWAEGKQYFDNYGRVESWMGICHGWAPAAYMLKRPTNAVSVQVSANGGLLDVVFYPSDIKGLATLLWAKSAPGARFIGGRCNDKDPAIDNATGRVISQDCFDTNPGTWHVALINQIRLNNRSFVMDATYDYEVWNQPVFGYEYIYFNPKAMQVADTFADAVVTRAEFDSDVFSEYRAEQTKALVGIAMNVTYMVEGAPTHNTTDSEHYDHFNTVYYQYDLELDAQGNIIGGEWHQNAHPDFLWTPAPGAAATTWADGYVSGVWDGAGLFPNSSWSSAAKLAIKDGAPLASIVDALIKRSRL